MIPTLPFYHPRKQLSVFLMCESRRAKFALSDVDNYSLDCLPCFLNSVLPKLELSLKPNKKTLIHTLLIFKPSERIQEHRLSIEVTLG